MAGRSVVNLLVSRYTMASGRWVGVEPVGRSVVGCW